MKMKEKKCFKCGAEKPLTDFYKHPRMSDGRVNKCKECNKKDVRQNRRAKIDYYRRYDRQRYREDEVRREATLHRFRNWSENNPAGKRASTMVANAVRDGRLEKIPCEVCGDPKSEAHHPDYAKPLDVMWLCRSHHIQWHHDNGPGKNADIPIDKMEAV